MAIEPEFIQKEMTQFFADIEQLLAQELSKEKVFYFAALIHLVFVHIHPFRDGNGRAARLLEKWFIAEKLGYHFWKIPSEEYYKVNQAEYYETLNLGFNYHELNYDQCLGFLEMLPHCIK